MCLRRPGAYLRAMRVVRAAQGRVRGISGSFWQTALKRELSTAESWGPAPAAWVPIQWLTTAQKTPFWRGDGIT